jgi:beta-lactamase superfamily II metal-dependent hydrolase
MLKIEMLPARHGDCLWIEYGSARKTYRMLIDAGPASTYKHLRERILALPESKRHFELFVITHIDADHIEGAVKLLQDKKLKISYGDIWFNGWKHLKRNPSRTLGGPLGEYLTSTILKEKLPWNVAFDGGTIVVPDKGKLPVRELRGEMKLTLLSPTWERLEKLRPKWRKEVLDAGLAPGHTRKAQKKLAATKRLQPILGAPRLNVEKLAGADSKSDSAAANGSSIAFLAEYDGLRCLFSGDAFPDVLAASLRRLLKKPSEKVSLDVFKLPHHGSRANVSAELIELVECGQYMFSSNGDIFEHPDREAVARVIWHAKTSPLLCFNYKTDFNKMWDSRNLLAKHSYQVAYPRTGKEGLLVELK